MIDKDVSMILAECYKELLPKIFEEAKDIGRQSVQVIIWLVGLSVGIIVLLINNQNIPYLTNASLIAALTLFSAVIIFGVAQRILYHWTEAINFPLMTALQGYFAGFTQPCNGPEELSEYWNKKEIVKQIEVGFGIDYNFLLHENITIDDCREAYIKQWQIHKEFETKRLSELADVLGAYLGQPDKFRKAFFNNSLEEDLLEASKKSAKVRKLYRCSLYCFIASVSSFAFAIVVITGSVILKLL